MVSRRIIGHIWDHWARDVSAWYMTASLVAPGSHDPKDNSSRSSPLKAEKEKNAKRDPLMAREPCTYGQNENDYPRTQNANSGYAKCEGFLSVFERTDKRQIDPALSYCMD